MIFWYLCVSYEFTNVLEKTKNRYLMLVLMIFIVQNKFSYTPSLDSITKILRLIYNIEQQSDVSIEQKDMTYNPDLG